MITEQDVKQRWEEIKDDEERILFIVGGAGSGKSSIMRALAEQENWKYLEAKELLDEEILEIARDMRPNAAHEIICQSLKACGSEVVMVDGVDILFAPILNLQPVQLLKIISKEFPLIVGWKGRREGDKLYLEHNNEPEYFTYDVEYDTHIMSVD